MHNEFIKAYEKKFSQISAMTDEEFIDSLKIRGVRKGKKLEQIENIVLRERDYLQEQILYGSSIAELIDELQLKYGEYAEISHMQARFAIRYLVTFGFDPKDYFQKVLAKASLEKKKAINRELTEEERIENEKKAVYQDVRIILESTEDV